jgi:serine protease Do
MWIAKSKVEVMKHFRFKSSLFVLVFSLFTTLTVYSSSAMMPKTSLAPMLKQVMPSVVNLQVIRPPMPIATPEHETPMSLPEPQRTVASGVIIDPSEGYILTNNHVVTNAIEIIVTLDDGRTFKAKTVGGDPESDIAVIQIEADDLKGIPLGDSDQLEVGDYVVAIGNPFGLEHSVTSGIVSGLGRTNLGIDSYENFIQTDASINPGNSGGALVNTQGQLVGINTAILTPGETPGNIGIGLAIPVNMAHSIMLQIVKFGEVRRGLLGVIAQPMTPEIASMFGRSNTSGALISYVAPDSLADQSGLRTGDIVISINGKNVSDSAQLRNTLGLIPIDNPFSMTILRNQKMKTIDFMMASPKAIHTQWEEASPLFAGLELGRIDQDIPSHGSVKGLQIFSLNPDSPAARAQLRPGDIIESVNQQPVHDLITLKEASKRTEKALLLHVLRGKGAFFTVLE